MAQAVAQVVSEAFVAILEHLMFQFWEICGHRKNQGKEAIFLGFFTAAGPSGACGNLLFGIEQTWIHIQRALLFIKSAAIESICIDQCCSDIAMTESLLDRPDIDISLRASEKLFFIQQAENLHNNSFEVIDTVCPLVIIIDN
jgi:hypothetical protein